MAFTTQKKQEIIKKFQSHDKDSGTAAVQVALWSFRITDLTEHFKKHKKDQNSRTGLLKLVSKRRSMLDYLKRKDHSRYVKLLAELKLRK